MLNAQTKLIITQEYTDDIIELLVNEYLSPQQVCDELTLCPWIIKNIPIIWNKLICFI